MAALLSLVPPTVLEQARNADLHRAFYTLRAHHENRIPSLHSLEFHTRPGVVPVSDSLEQIISLLQDFSSSSRPFHTHHYFWDPLVPDDAFLAAAKELTDLLAFSPNPSLDGPSVV